MCLHNCPSATRLVAVLGQFPENSLVCEIQAIDDLSTVFQFPTSSFLENALSESAIGHINSRPAGRQEQTYVEVDRYSVSDHWIRANAATLHALANTLFGIQFTVNITRKGKTPATNSYRIVIELVRCQVTYPDASNINSEFPLPRFSTVPLEGTGFLEIATTADGLIRGVERALRELARYHALSVGFVDSVLESSNRFRHQQALVSNSLAMFQHNKTARLIASAAKGRATKATTKATNKKAKGL
jgi:hypothetical protein